MDLLWLTVGVELSTFGIILLLGIEGGSLGSEVEDVLSIVGGGSVGLWNQSMNLLWLNVSVEFSFLITFGRGLSVEGCTSWSKSVNNVWSILICLWSQDLDLLWLSVSIKSGGWSSISLSQFLLSIIGGSVLSYWSGEMLNLLRCLQIPPIWVETWILWLVIITLSGCQ